MHQLTILGLGPGGKQYLTLEALECIKTGRLIHARTMKHPVMDYLIEVGGQFQGMDHFYDAGQTFDAVYQSIADDIVGKLAHEDVIYAVPGNPFVAEKTVALLLERVNPDKVDIIHGASFIDAIITTLHIDPVHGLKIIDGLKIEDSRLDVLSDALIIQVYDQQAASRVKLSLMALYEDDHEVCIVRGAGVPGQEIIEKVPLYALDRSEALDHLTSVYIPRVEPSNRKTFVLEDLSQVMTKLRSEEGCAWDRAQTHESLKKSLIEETYEVIQTIEDDDLWGLEEELGDLLLQIVFHAEIAGEQGYFSINDVITGIYEKMIRRHPHVFSDGQAEDVEAVLDQWDKIKAQEKDVQDIPKAFPPLLRTEKILKRLKKVPGSQEMFIDVNDRIKKGVDALLAYDKVEDLEALTFEVGQLIFDLTYVVSGLKIDINEGLASYGEAVLEEIEADDLPSDSADLS